MGTRGSPSLPKTYWPQLLRRRAFVLRPESLIPSRMVWGTMVLQAWSPIWLDDWASMAPFALARAVVEGMILLAELLVVSWMDLGPSRTLLSGWLACRRSSRLGWGCRSTTRMLEWGSGLWPTTPLSLPFTLALTLAFTLPAPLRFALAPLVTFSRRGLVRSLCRRSLCS